MTVFYSDKITTERAGNLIDSRTSKAREFIEVDKVSLAGAVADNDIIAICRLPVNHILPSIKVFSDDLGTTGDFNVGFYPIVNDFSTLAHGDALDEDAIGTAIDFNAAALSESEIRFETKDITTIGQKVWELIGLSSEPDYSEVLLCLTATEATTAAGDISFITRHIGS